MGSKDSISTFAKFDRFTRRVSRAFEVVGLAGLLLIMVITCVDVVGAKLFLKPIFGALDIVMLSQLVAISFAIPFSLLLGRHVAVEFFVVKLPARPQALIDIIISLLILALFVLIIWRISVYGYSFQAGGEVSPTIRIPLYPFAYAVAFAGIPVCLVLISGILKSLRGIRKK
jgi:TRAP-type C4-dicarboxylate transport system permease small subunit